MNCLVSQDPQQVPAVGDTPGLSIDIGQEIQAFIQANPVVSIGLALALGFGIYSIFKK